MMGLWFGCCMGQLMDEEIFDFWELFEEFGCSFGF
jgi:hypothetical protein